MLDKREIGLKYLLQSSLSPFFWMGIAFALELCLGWKTDLLYYLKGFENNFLNNFKILVGILSGPLALFVFIELIRSSISSGRVGERKIVLLFSWPK